MQEQKKQHKSTNTVIINHEIQYTCHGKIKIIVIVDAIIYYRYVHAFR